MPNQITKQFLWELSQKKKTKNRIFKKTAWEIPNRVAERNLKVVSIRIHQNILQDNIKNMLKEFHKEFLEEFPKQLPHDLPKKMPQKFHEELLKGFLLEFSEWLPKQLPKLYPEKLLTDFKKKIETIFRNFVIADNLSKETTADISEALLKNLIEEFKRTAEEKNDFVVLFCK